jgi:hypothetical protein
MGCVFIIREADTTAAVDDFSQPISLALGPCLDRGKLEFFLIVALSFVIDKYCSIMG